MNVRTLVNDLEARFALRRFVVVGLIGSVAANIVLAAHALLAPRDWRVELVVPPPSSGSAWVARNEISREYLDMMAMYVIQLALNVSAASADTQFASLLRMVHPAAYGDVQKILEGNAIRLKSTSSATSFWPGEALVNPSQRAVLVRGLLSTWIADRRTSQVDRSYLLRFDYQAGRLLLREFLEGDFQKLKPLFEGENRGA